MNETWMNFVVSYIVILRCSRYVKQFWRIIILTISIYTTENLKHGRSSNTVRRELTVDLNQLKYLALTLWLAWSIWRAIVFPLAIFELNPTSSPGASSVPSLCRNSLLSMLPLSSVSNLKKICLILCGKLLGAESSCHFGNQLPGLAQTKRGYTSSLYYWYGHPRNAIKSWVNI